MKTSKLLEHCLLVCLLLCLQLQVMAQVRRPRGIAAKDSIQLSCLLNQAKQVKETAADAAKELKLALTTGTDTTVKACIDAEISVIQRDEQGKWEIVFAYKDYWFWLSGITKPAVQKGQKIKRGAALGYIAPGDTIELLMYDFETPVDPKKYMQCRE